MTFIKNDRRPINNQYKQRVKKSYKKKVFNISSPYNCFSKKGRIIFLPIQVIWSQYFQILNMIYLREGENVIFALYFIQKTLQNKIKLYWEPRVTNPQCTTSKTQISSHRRAVRITFIILKGLNKLHRKLIII